MFPHEIEFIEFCEKNIEDSRSQILQDLFALWSTNSRINGFFVEFGSADGITHSNSYLLETKYGWSGLLIEPDPGSFRTCQRLRKKAVCINAAVDPLYREDSLRSQLVLAGQLSGLKDHLSQDYHTEARLSGKNIQVNLINLNVLLEKQAPTKIDYISIDTEGSEADIVEGFNWEHFLPYIVTIETNGVAQNEERIINRMKRANYKNFNRCISRWDLWFIRKL